MSIALSRNILNFHRHIVKFLIITIITSFVMLQMCAISNSHHMMKGGDGSYMMEGGWGKLYDGRGKGEGKSLGADPRWMDKQWRLEWRLNGGVLLIF